MTKCVSPWYNHTGWLGVKHQLLTYLLAQHKLNFEEALKKKKERKKKLCLLSTLKTTKPKKQQWGTAETTKTVVSVVPHCQTLSHGHDEWRKTKIAVWIVTCWSYWFPIRKPLTENEDCCLGCVVLVILISNKETTDRKQRFLCRLWRVGHIDFRRRRHWEKTKTMKGYDDCCLDRSVLVLMISG